MELAGVSRARFIFSSRALAVPTEENPRALAVRNFRNGPSPGGGGEKPFSPLRRMNGRQVLVFSPKNLSPGSPANVLTGNTVIPCGNVENEFDVKIRIRCRKFNSKKKRTTTPTRKRKNCRRQLPK